MPSLLAKSISAGLSRLEQLTDSETVTIGGTAIPCTANTNQRGTIIDIGGNPSNIAVTLFVRLEALAVVATDPIDGPDNQVDSSLGIPASGSMITFRGEGLRVLTTDRAAGGSHVAIHCANDNA